MSPTRREVSAGFVVFRPDSPRRYLFLTHRGRYDIPKGLKQSGEDDITTAVRELFEETGIGKPIIVEGFNSRKHYFYRWKNDLVSKDVVYFLADYPSGDILISGEHDGFAWLTKDEALERLRYPSLKEVIVEADRFLEGQVKKARNPQDL
jgi:8-oxo-dGTP pyrophosphatase MutT (NUDIX family)